MAKWGQRPALVETVKMGDSCTTVKGKKVDGLGFRQLAEHAIIAVDINEMWKSS